MKKFFNAISKVLDYFELVVTGVCLICMVVFIAMQVFCRYVLNSPLSWTEEFARYLMIVMVFIGVSMAIKSNSHMGVSSFVDMLPNKIKYVIEFFGMAVMLVLYAALCYLGLTLMKGIFSSGQVSSVMRVPMWIFYSCFPVGFALSVIREIEVMYKFAGTHWLKRDDTLANLKSEKGD